MTGIRRFLAALAACTIVAGCASAPISVSSRFSPAAGAASPQQAELADTAARFADTARERGWIRAAGSMETAMHWMGQLTGQADDTDDDGNATPVARYLRVNDTALDAPDFATRLLTDIALARELTGAIDAAAADMISHGGGNSRAALSLSIGQVETATARARDTLALFDALIGDMPTPSDADLARQLVSERDLLAARTDSLRERVGELVELRRRSGSADSFS